MNQPKIITVVAKSGTVYAASPERIARLLDQDQRVAAHMQKLRELDVDEPYKKDHGHDTVMLALASVRDTFLEYAEHHRAKARVELGRHDRAKRNEDMAYLVGNVMQLIEHERAKAAALIAPEEG